MCLVFRIAIGHGVFPAERVAFQSPIHIYHSFVWLFFSHFILLSSTHSLRQLSTIWWRLGASNNKNAKQKDTNEINAALIDRKSVSLSERVCVCFEKRARPFSCKHLVDKLPYKSRRHVTFTFWFGFSPFFFFLLPIVDSQESLCDNNRANKMCLILTPFNINTKTVHPPISTQMVCAGVMYASDVQHCHHFLFSLYESS